MSARRLACALLACLALATSGCFVFDEMDKSAKLENSVVPKKDAPETGAKMAAEPKPKAGAAAKPAGPKGAAWWQTARSITSEESGTEIARCDVGGRVEFMERSECAARGGHAKD